MTEKNKYIDGEKEFYRIGNELINFSGIHKEIKEDFKTLILLTKVHKENHFEFNALFRACVRGIFTINEAVIYYFNIIDPYKNYSDNDRFIDKLKKTFKKIGSTFGKEEIIKEYFDTKLEDLIKLKLIREDVQLFFCKIIKPRLTL